MAENGDIANRSEAVHPAKVRYIQSAATSWSQFETDYINGLSLTDKQGGRAPLYIIPGNHDVTNAIGFYKPMNPTTDATAMAEIYNLMMKPATPRTKNTYNYIRDKIFFSKDIGGVHFVFLTIWPDSVARTWMESDLKNVSATTPVILFTHDQPDIDVRHLTNPNGAHDINSTDKFENMVADQATDADSSGKLTSHAPTTTAQRNLVAFLKAHKNIVAYFHGHEHINGTYTYTGPDHDISLNAVRVDSPMKGVDSAKDPTQLAFIVVSIDPNARTMTVRDYMWYTQSWGKSVTFSLGPRPQ
ncbi:MAG: metallophosphoesterase [Deltaproteobacteria bacterium]|nr:metallophosphoesterase [Deltaproteobacteria bacterium]